MPDCTDFADRLLRWFDVHGRKSLPWQRDRDPYRIWVAEIMLQQTQVRTVIPYFERFMARLPTLAALAGCDADELLHLWSGLGYYARARNLHAAARQIIDRHGGEFPRQFEQALALPGIGRSTAGAIAAFAWGQRRAILDGNVRRVLSRHRAVDGNGARLQAELWRLAERLTPAARPDHYAQASMDLGATVCRRSRPQCHRCPVAADCQAHLRGEPAAFPGRPSKSAQPARRRRAVTMLIVRNRRAELLLIKRPPCGIWGGLWSLPEGPGGPNPASWTMQDAAGRYFSAADAEPGPAAHGLTQHDAHGRAVEKWCEQHLGLAIQCGAPWPMFTHSFTHFDLDIRPWPAVLAAADSPRPPGEAESAMDAARHLWYNPNCPPRIGLPTAVSRILSML